MTYRDVTLAPEDIEWDRVTAWDAAHNQDSFNEFLGRQGLVRAIYEFARQHRIIADKCISHPNPPSNWVYATRTFKRARIDAFKIHEELHGTEETDKLRKEVRDKYPRIDGRKR